LKILVSHSNPEFVAGLLADKFFLDFDPTPDFSYVDFVKKTCLSEKVNIFWPSRGAFAISEVLEKFRELGVHVILPADFKSLKILNDKGEFYQRARQLGLDLPDYRRVTTFQEFQDAVADFLNSGKTVCFKPTTSLYGLGFKIIDNRKNPLDAFLKSESTRVDLATAKSILDVPDTKFPSLLVMEYLPGPEYSIDCLAKDGTILALTIRKKPYLVGGAETLVRDLFLASICQKIASEFRLNYLFNIQFREGNQKKYLLELNPRLSGGLYFSCLGGINYPYWALRMLLAQNETLEIPEQSYDIKVNQAYEPFIY
jgi:carbamoylphosphate synthase large subunit